MATITDFGGPTDTLATPSLSEWAAAVADRLTADAWTSWTPTLTAFTCSAVDAKYMQSHGGLVLIHAVFTVATMGTSPTFTLPVAAVGDGAGDGILRVGGIDYLGSVRPSTGSALLFTWGASATYVNRQSITAAVPATWAAGDKITATMFYRAAAMP